MASYAYLWIPSTVGVIKCLVMKPIYRNNQWVRWRPSYSNIQIADIASCTDVGTLFRSYYSDLGGRKISAFCMLGRSDSPAFTTPPNAGGSPVINATDCQSRSIVTGDYIGFGRANANDTACSLCGFYPMTYYYNGELYGTGGIQGAYALEFQSTDWSKDWFLVIAPNPNSNATSEDDYTLEHTDMESSTVQSYIACADHSAIESGSGSIVSSNVHILGSLWNLFCTGFGNSYSETEPSPDPPDPDPDPDPDGGEDMPIPDPPLKDGINTGFQEVFLTNKTELQDLAGDLSDPDIISALERWLGSAQPIDGVLMLNIFPYSGYIPTSGSVQNIVIGGVTMTHAMALKATRQFIQVDFGTCACPRKFNNALDYAPYTNVSLYLPYIGTIDLPTNAVMNKYIGVCYNIDIVTGTITAFITTGTGNNRKVIMTAEGSCLVQIPVTSHTVSEWINAISVGVNTATALTTGMPAAKLGAVGLGSIQKDSISTRSNNTMTAGYMNIHKPAIYVERPKDATPVGYKDTIGYVTPYVATLSSVSGFCQVKDVHISGLTSDASTPCVATKAELDEIETLLKGGVHL